MNASRTAALVALLLLVPAPARAQRAVILVRHADKETDPAKVAGLDDLQIPLSAAGKTRADALAFLLKDAGITAIYTSPALRTQATARPLAGQLMIEPKVLDDTRLGRLAEQDRDGVVLIVGHTNTVPGFIEKLLNRRAGIVIGEEEYDRLFVLTRKADGSFGLVRARY
jgi:phosphohistidine phosphatase SixA